jgi:hypothetical protein
VSSGPACRREGVSEVMARCRQLLGFSRRLGNQKDEVLKIIEGLT